MKLLLLISYIYILACPCPGQCDVDSVLVLLVQEMIYTCNPGEDDERSKKEVLVISEDKDEADADPGTTKIYDKLKLKVPR